MSVQEINSPNQEEPLTIWRFLDGKPGHENQTLGLTRALARLRAVRIHDVVVPSPWRSWLAWLMRRCPIHQELPQPDLLVGAGHRTHRAMLACRRVHGGRVVVMMRPSVSLSRFDLCIAPAHDRLPDGGNILQTRGVLNAVDSAMPSPDRAGLILVGGPSSHYGWNDAELRAQIAALTTEDDRSWIVATSRRTPKSTEQMLGQLQQVNLTVQRWQDAPAGWLLSQLPGTPVIWVTEDSVSMLYEALTAGAACGVLPVPVKRPGRVSEGVRQLINDDMVHDFKQWQSGASLCPPAESFDEATRCAKAIVERWFAN